MKFFKVLDTKEAKKIVKDNIEAAALKVTSRKTSDAADAAENGKTHRERC